MYVSQVAIVTMGKDNNTDEFDFDKWAEEFSLSTQTVDKLKEEDANCLVILQALQESDIADFGLNIGQKAVLRAAVSSLKVDVKPAPSTLGGIPISQIPSSQPSAVDREKELNDLLSSLKSEVLPGMTASASKDNADYGSGYNPYKLDFPVDHSSCNKRVLRIPDFVTKNRDAHDDEDVDEVVKGGRLLIRKDNKPKVSEVTLPEWISANARILKKLIEQKEIVSLEQVIEYMEYTAKLGDHAVKNTIASVMRYDDKFRSEQVEKARKWDEDDPFLMHNNLEKRQSGSYGQRNMSDTKPPAKVFSEPRQRIYDRGGREICYDYQTSKGCRRFHCQFSHVCIEAGCEAQHPCYLHFHLQNTALRPQAPPFAPPSAQYGGSHGYQH